MDRCTMSLYEALDLFLPLVGFVVAFMLRAVKRDITTKIESLQKDIDSLDADIKERLEQVHQKHSEMENDIRSKFAGIRALIQSHNSALSVRAEKNELKADKLRASFTAYVIKMEQYKADIEAYKRTVAEQYATTEHYSHRMELITRSIEKHTEKQSAMHQDIGKSHQDIMGQLAQLCREHREVERM